MYPLFEELAYVQISVAHDIEPRHVMRAPQRSGDLTSASPYTGRTYNYRIINFELAEKVLLPMEAICADHNGWMCVFTPLPP
jgi:hypothetical protein